MELENKTLWIVKGENYYRTSDFKRVDKLDNAVYTYQENPMTGERWLERVSDSFTFDYKVYGLEKELVDRVVKTYKQVNNNIGVLLNGLKGTGKTVTSKMLANAIGQPTILVTAPTETGHLFLNEIDQDITIFIDEYEKIYEESDALLTIMDGALNSNYKRLFLLTTNKLYISENLISRPSRIRYLKTFGDLPQEVVAEIVDDILIHKELREATIGFISKLELITVDIVKSVLSEVNIHNEDPNLFANVFNVKKLYGNHNVSIYNPSSEDKFTKFEKIADDCKVYPRAVSTGHIGRWFEIEDETVGIITEVINETTFKVKPINSPETKKVLGKFFKLPTVAEGKKKTKKDLAEEVVVKIEPAEMVHSNYTTNYYM